MTQLIKIMFGYPAIFLLQQTVRRSFIIIGLCAFASLYFLQNFYTNTYDDDLQFDEFQSENSESNEVIYNNAIETSIEEKIIEQVIVQKGDTLAKILRNQNLTNEESEELISLAQKEKISSNLKIGQILSFYYNNTTVKNADFESYQKSLLTKISMKLDKVKSIDFVKQGDNFVVSHASIPLKKLIVQNEAIVESSLIDSLKKSGMTNGSIMKLIDAYSHQIDFQRQIKTGDKITVVSEKFVTDQNDFSHYGKILHASLKTKDNEYNIYHYAPDKNSDATFFSEEGQTIKSTLLRNPIKVSRISGHFGYRKKHPVLGYGAMHKGIDFAATTGTPIHSAGSGVVKFAGWKSGYGKLVIIEHNKNLSTVYAHASKFAKNIKPGFKVKQGDVLAYVGSTGRTTGPHLHYEVRVNGEQVNPLQFKSTPAVQLAGAKLSNFKKYKENIKKLTKKLGKNVEFVDTNITDI